MNLREILIKANVSEEENILEKEIETQFESIKITALDGEDFFRNLFISYEEGNYQTSVDQQSLFSKEESKPGTTISNEQLECYEQYKIVCDESNKKIQEIITTFVNNHYNSMKLPE